MSFAQTLSAHKGLSITVGILLLLIVAVVLFSRSNKVAPVGWGWYGAVHTQDGLALGGYDAVSYFDGTPRMGDAGYAVSRDGAEWRFASAENKAAFEATPERYMPQYGGFCAFAVSKGFTAKTDPTVWHVADGQLYVFDSAKVKTDWLADATASRSKGAENWASR